MLYNEDNLMTIIYKKVTVEVKGDDSNDENNNT